MSRGHDHILLAMKWDSSGLSLTTHRAEITFACKDTFQKILENPCKIGRNVEMNVGFFKTFIVSLLLCSLLWVAACANGATGPGPTGSSYGSYSTPLAPEQSDPQFWQIWVDMHGGG